MYHEIAHLIQSFLNHELIYKIYHTKFTASYIHIILAHVFTVNIYLYSRFLSLLLSTTTAILVITTLTDSPVVPAPSHSPPHEHHSTHHPSNTHFHQYHYPIDIPPLSYEGDLFRVARAPTWTEFPTGNATSMLWAAADAAAAVVD